MKWQNFSIKKSEARAARMKTYAVMLTCLIVCGGLTTVLLSVQDFLCASDDDCKDDEGRRTNAFWLSLTPLVGILLFNLGLQKLSKKLVEEECWPTNTEKDASLMVKLTFSQVLNTVFVIVLLNYEVEDWYRQGGLVYDIAGVTMGTAIGPQLTTIFGVSMFCKRRGLQSTLANFDPNKPGTMTQEKLNKLFEDPPLDLPKRYATVIKIFILGLNFMVLVPFFAPVITLVLVVAYWADKYALLRNCSRPYTQSALMPKTAGNILMYCVLVHAASIYWFLTPCLDERAKRVCMVLAGLCGIVGFVVLMLPSNLKRCLFCCCSPRWAK